MEQHGPLVSMFENGWRIYRFENFSMKKSVAENFIFIFTLVCIIKKNWCESVNLQNWRFSNHVHVLCGLGNEGEVSDLKIPKNED